VESAGDAELADERDIIVRRMLQRPSLKGFSYDQGRECSLASETRYVK
jgi:hypothetical protein